MLVLDFGCGWLKYPSSVKHYPKRFAKVFSENTEIIGIDVCKYNNDIIASALQSPFRNEIAEAIVCRHLLEHIDSVSLIREMWKTLKPDGKLLLETPNGIYIFRVIRALFGKEANPHTEHIQTFTSAELRNLLRRNGFELMDLDYFNLDVENPNLILSIAKKVIAYIIDKIFPMFDRIIIVIASKNANMKFVEYT